MQTFFYRGRVVKGINVGNGNVVLVKPRQYVRCLNVTPQIKKLMQMGVLIVRRPRVGDPVVGLPDPSEVTEVTEPPAEEPVEEPADAVGSGEDEAQAEPDADDSAQPKSVPFEEAFEEKGSVKKPRKKRTKTSRRKKKE